MKFNSLSEKLEASDLFFNYNHPAYDELYQTRRVIKDEEIRAALLKDAQEFVDLFGGDAQWYVEDFMRRV